jgi:RNA polymerase sigma-70 factor (ECF subfamily)
MSEQEFGSALTSHSKPLMGFAMKLTKDYDQANDLLQETFFKAYKNRDKFQEGTNLSGWLFTIMKNAFITNYQRIARQKTFVDTTDNLYHINNTHTMVRNGAVTEITMKEINEEIDKLEDKIKVPFYMHYRGFKYQEIAERLSIPMGTVKNRIHVARQQLQDVLARKKKITLEVVMED